MSVFVQPNSLFCFGSLRSTAVMAALTGTPYAAIPARLEGFLARKIRGECFPGLAQAEGAEAQGLLYHNLSLRDWSTLDAFEGAMYQRSLVEVKAATSVTVKAWAYLMAPDYAHLLSQEAWSFETFLEKDLESFIQVCASFPKASQLFSRNS